jgi:membrane protein required for beta-lactamase induction
MDETPNNSTPLETAEHRVRLLEEKLRVLRFREGQAEERLKKEQINAERTGWLLLGNLMILALCAVILFYGLAGRAIGWASLAILLVLLAFTLTLIVLSRSGVRDSYARLQALRHERGEAEASLNSLRGEEAASASEAGTGGSSEFGV